MLQRLKQGLPRLVLAAVEWSGRVVPFASQLRVRALCSGIGNGDNTRLFSVGNCLVCAGGNNRPGWCCDAFDVARDSARDNNERVVVMRVLEAKNSRDDLEMQLLSTQQVLEAFREIAVA
ncbi:MAG: hypothetical protein FWD57_16825, partial [Polyangiaceae bacterium]|nr:hypothetical protein [Polyangiaceae bacterium]